MKQKIVVKARFIPRCKSLEEWKIENPVLLAGEHGVAIDGKGDEREKIGDGVTAWNELEWWNGLSAYEIAVKNGFVGTEKEWLESLKIDGIDSSDTDITVKKHLIADAGLYVNSPDNYNCDLSLNNEGLVFNGADNYLTVPTSGPITIYGVGGIDVDGCRIKNLDGPIDNSDAANKEYVDKKVNKITRGNVTAIDDYDSTEDSVPYFYGVYGDKAYDYEETQGLIVGSMGTPLQVMIDCETAPEKKALLEKGIMPDHSYVDPHTVVIRDGNASVPVGVMAAPPPEFDENTGNFIYDKPDVLWYGGAVPTPLLFDVHNRSKRYAEYTKDVAIKETLKHLNIKNGNGEDNLQQDTCAALCNYNVAMGNGSQAGVKGCKIKDISIRLFSEDLGNAAILILETPIKLPEGAVPDEVHLGIGAYAQLDLSKHWYNRYYVFDANWIGNETDGFYITGFCILPLYPDLYPINETNISLGDGDTDNWVWFTDNNGNEWFTDVNEYYKLEGAVPIDQYIGGFATGHQSLAAGYGAFAAGRQCKAIGNYSIALGRQTTADYASMAIGLKTHALGQQSLASGSNTKATGSCAVSEGNQTVASGDYSHAFGLKSQAKGQSSIAGGNECIANSYYGVALGSKTQARANASIALGVGTIADTSKQVVIGGYNKIDNDALFIIGNGTSDTDRSNIFAVYKDGSIKLGNTTVTEQQLQKLLALIE